jgi:hypothetical protein
VSRAEADEAPTVDPGTSAGLTIDRVWASLPFFIPAIVCLASGLVAIDLAYQVRAGDVMLRTHALLDVDTFTFTVPGTSWLNQQWGAQVLLALLHRGGWGLVAVGRAVLVAGTFGLVYLSCRERGAGPRTGSLLAIAGFVVALPALAMRPQTFCLPMFALTLWVVVRRREHPQGLWVVPALMIPWANIHGSFVLPLLVLGLAWLEDVRSDRPTAKRLIVVGLIGVACTLVNPFGVNVWRYVWDISSNPIIRNTVTEWAPMDVTSFAGVLFFASVLGVVVILARRPAPTRWIDLLWLGVFFLLTLPAQRGVVWWSLAAPVVVAGLIPARAASSSRPEIPSLNKIVVGALAALVVILLPWWRGTSPDQLLLEAPVGLADAARAQLPPGTRIAVTEPWASWFEYADPDLPVMVDPRIELYPRWVWEDYGQLRGPGSDWRAVLDRWGIQAVVADKRDWRLIPLLGSDPDWRVGYEDEDGVLFVRA